MEYSFILDRDEYGFIYGFRKMITLLLNCNPNTLELLGLKPEHYLYLNGFGKEVITYREKEQVRVLHAVESGSRA